MKFKALYKMMMDHLKDAGMWLDWAKDLKQTEPELAKYLMDAAEQRMDKDYKMSKQWFDKLCMEDKQSGPCMNDMVSEQMEGWYDELKMRLKKYKEEK